MSAKPLSDRVVYRTTRSGAPTSKSTAVDNVCFNKLESVRRRVLHVAERTGEQLTVLVRGIKE